MLLLLLNMHNTVCFQQAVWGCRYASKSKFHIVTLDAWTHIVTSLKCNFQCDNLLHNNCKTRKKENSCHICADWENTQQIVSLWNDLWNTGSPSGHCNFHASGFSSSVPLMQKCVDAEWGLSEARWDRAQLLCSQHEGLYITHALDKSALLCPNKDTPSQPHQAQNETLPVFNTIHSELCTANISESCLWDSFNISPKNVHEYKCACNQTSHKNTPNWRSLLCSRRSNPFIWLCAVFFFSLISLHCLHQLWKASEGSRWTITCRIIKHHKSPRVYKYRLLQSFSKHHSNHQHYFWM